MFRNPIAGNPMSRNPMSPSVPESGEVPSPAAKDAAEAPDRVAGSDSADPQRTPDRGLPGKISSYATTALIVLAILYAFLAGFHTVHDYDLGWQLATGRWVAEHHQVPRVDVFSYTAQGKPWTYPVVSGLIFHFLHRLGGYEALSWLTGIALALTAFLLTRQRSLATAALAIIAVPVLADRSAARADLFSTVLFAAFMALLWSYHRRVSGAGSEAPSFLARWGGLWLLPLLAAAWVNLHLGFVAGLGLCAAYVLVEALELPFAERRAAALERLRRAWPWLAGAAVAIVLNPWGFGILTALVRQQEAMKTHSVWIDEWAGLRISASMLEQALLLRDPDGAIWWLLIAALLCAVVAAGRRQFGAAILLAGSVYVTVRSLRFEALAAAIIVVVGGSVVSDAVGALRRSDVPALTGARRFVLSPVPPLAVVLCFALLSGVRISDLVTDRLYLSSPTTMNFGSGLSWWFPEDALAFVQRERLPRNIFNDYNTGGYLTWRAPEYPVYIDGRAIPFGAEHFYRAVYDLPNQPPDSAAWQQEADARGINTLIISIARYDGLEYFPNLRDFCDSQSWRPVYLDEVSAVFLRRRPENQALIERLEVSCDRVTFTPPADGSRAEQFNFWLNSAVVLEALGRSQESMQALQSAHRIFPDNGDVHYMFGVALMNSYRQQGAERELRRAIELNPTESTWSMLAQLLVSERRLPEAAEAARKSAELSSHPQQIYLGLAKLYLDMGQPQKALDAFDDASRFDIFANDSGSIAAEVHAQVAEGQARAWWALGERDRAIDLQKKATEFTPQNSARWKQLAGLYQAQGRTDEAQRAMEHVQPGF
jgi:tetratricopeptide (TPR) repeat protein